MKVVLLAGGTGGAKLAQGLDAELAPGELTVIANTGDDLQWWGVHVSPDVDAVMYRLARIFDDEKGYGIRGDTHAAMERMRAMGRETWFELGDQDLAVAVQRTELLRDGLSLTEATLELCSRLELNTAVLPMSDKPAPVTFHTDSGELSFQEYFVRDRLQPRLRSVSIPRASASDSVKDALAEAQLVVIGPSNPIASIRPILSAVSRHLDRDRTIAICPIVGGESLKGPTVDMMSTLGLEPTALGVAREYEKVARRFVLDGKDAQLRSSIEALGLEVQVTDTVMNDEGRSLARFLLGL